jgi:outer membrane protein assembly factor BamB
MSVIDAPPEPKRSRFRVWFPWAMVLLAVGGTAASWLWPSEAMETGMRSAGTFMAVMLALIGFEIWLLIYHRWLALLGILLAGLGIAGLYTGVIKMKQDGDVVPTSVYVPYFSSPDQDLETYRAANAGSAAPVANDGLTVTAEDMPAYRGELRDGIAHGPALARDWAAQLPRELWRHPVGGGYAAFAVAGKVAITIEQRQDDEAVVCYDTDTGAERWVYSYPANFTEPLGGPGPRATPTIFEGEVYSLGAKGHLACLNGRDGKEKWQTNILAGNKNLQWAMSGSPLILGDLVIVNPGVQDKSASGLKALHAYDRKTGKLVWASGDTVAGYASPMLAKFADVEQVLLFDGVELAGYAAKDGKKLWSTPWKTHQDINVAQPLLFDGDRVFISSAYGVGCAMFQIVKNGDKWEAKELWKNKVLRAKMSSPVAYQDHIYGLDDGVLTCLSAKDGSRKWKGGRYGHGEPILSGDLIVILTESGKLVLVEATPQVFHELGSIQAIKGRTWNYPALARGKVFVRNDVEMAAYDLTGK